MSPPTTSGRIHRLYLRIAILIAITAALAASLGLTACTPDTTAASAPIVIVAPSTSAEPQPSIPKPLEAELVSYASSAKKPGDAVVRIVSSVNGPVIGRDLTPLRGKDVEHGSAKDRKIHESIAALQQDLANLQASAPGLELVRLMDRGSQYPRARMFVLSSGASTEPPVDLDARGLNFNPEDIAESIHRQGLLNLTGHHVTYAGLGVVGGSQQPRLPAFARKQLEALWLQICEKAGADRCVVAESEPVTVPPRATLPVPIVPVPAAYTDADGCARYAQLDDQTLHFAPDSAALPASADEVLRPLVESARRCRVRQVDVIGHIACTTPDGRDSSNLSGRRAEAVAARLVALGLPSSLLGTVTGRGANEPVIPNLTPDGLQFIEAAAVLNRRVEVTLEQ
ncbi:OmpA family protein [Nocardia amamiensis]|uniref:OmpA family protein n=1 Tax=Nocardia amamiensis TaxID=404578 RepID=A0ABS0CQS4_9NOCA|nr:OmpA family protein [Nocardia amamiensis]MBF6298974.1 OmpA family protein [Nocardia amamiensis]